MFLLLLPFVAEMALPFMLGGAILTAQKISANYSNLHDNNENEELK